MLFLLIIAGDIEAANVNQEKAASDIEKLICGDEELVRLHEILSDAYLKALNSSRRDEVVVSQDQWIQNERNECKDTECLNKTYRARISELGLTGSFGIVFLRPNAPKASSSKAPQKKSKSQAIERPNKSTQKPTDQQLKARLKRLRKAKIETSANDQLVWAAEKGSLDQVKTWLEKGANVNTKKRYGKTILMTAVGKTPEVAKLLIDKGADVNSKDDTGRSVLMTAVAWGNLEVVKLLLEKGADVNARNHNGDTALKMAQNQGHTKIVKLLKAHGAKD
jgi:uncharacterized protein